MATARFKIYDPIAGDRTVTEGLQSQMSVIFCEDQEGIDRSGFGYTWERRLSDTHSQIWIRTSDEVMNMIKAQFSSPDFVAIGFEHLEDIEEETIEEVPADPDPA